MAFKMKGFSPFTKNGEYIPQTQRNKPKSNTKENKPPNTPKKESLWSKVKNVYLNEGWAGQGGLSKYKWYQDLKKKK